MLVDDRDVYVPCRQGGFICIIRNRMPVVPRVDDIVRAVPEKAHISTEFEYDVLANELFADSSE